MEEALHLSSIWPSCAPGVLRGARLSSVGRSCAPKMPFGVYNIICPKRQRRSTAMCSGRTLNIIRAPFFSTSLRRPACLRPDARRTDVGFRSDARLAPMLISGQVLASAQRLASGQMLASALMLASGQVAASAQMLASGQMLASALMVGRSENSQFRS